jgi:hypothetical protein
MTQQLFAELTANPPPSTVDVPAIIRREKRRRALTRTSVPLAAVLALVSAIAVLSPGTGGPGRAPSAARPGLAADGPGAAAARSGPAAEGSGPAADGSGPATEVPSVPGFRLVANNRVATAATAKSLRGALAAAVQQAAPGATWLAQGLTKSPTPDGQPPRIVGDDLKRPTDQMFTGTTGIALNGRRGTLSLNIISMNPCTGGTLAKCPAGHSSPPDMAKGLYACQPAAQKCTAGTGSDGRRQRIQTTTSLGGFISQETTVELADGRALMLTVDNQFIPPGRTNNHDDVAQSTTPLSPAQVSTIAVTIGSQILP